jgi:hypothetical protein
MAIPETKNIKLIRYLTPMKLQIRMSGKQKSSLKQGITDER